MQPVEPNEPAAPPPDGLKAERDRGTEAEAASAAARAPIITPSRVSSLRERLIALARFRGEQPGGLSLVAWFAIIIGTWAAARLVAHIDPFWTMVPPALGLSVAVSVVRAQRRMPGRATPRWFEPTLVSTALLVLAWGTLGYVYRFRLPFDTGDHQIMAAKAELFAKGLLHGRWVHWTHLFQGGDTLTDLYPIFFNFLTAIVYAVVPKSTVSFMAVYSALVVFGWWLRGAAAYTLCRRFASPLPSALATLVALYDVGADVSDGVWNGAFYWGMIHNNVALSLGLFATAAQIDVCRGATTRHVLRCALLCAAASFAHPLGLLYVVVSTASLGLSTAMYTPRFRRPLWALAASTIGLLLAGAWILPYTNALKTLGFNGAVPGIDYHELGTGLLNGHAPTSSFGAFIGIGFLAIVVAVTSGRPLVAASGLTSLLFLLLGLTPLVVGSRLAVYFPSFLDGQQRRMLTVVKAAVLPCAAYTVGLALAHLRSVRATLAPRAVLARAIVLGLLLYGPGRALVWGAGEVVQTLQAQNPKGPSGTRGRSATNPDQDAAFAWIKARRAEDKTATPWRVALFDRFANGAFIHSTWVEGMNTGAPVVDFGWESAVFIGLRPREMSPQGFTDWNIRYALGRSATPPFAGLTDRFTAGVYHVWEFNGYDDHYVTAPGSVAVSGLSFDDDTIAFDVAGAPPEGVDVQVRCAWFPRWQAQQNGRSIDVVASPPHAGAKPRQEQLRVHAQNGHVELRCNRAMPRFAAGLVLSLGGVAAFVIVASIERRRRAEALATAALDRAKSWLEAARAKGREHPRLRAFAFAVPVVALVAFSFLRGGTVLLSPAIEGGAGLSVSAVAANGESASCMGAFWTGTYDCQISSPPARVATLDHWVGAAPVTDDSGEYASEWPGLRVTLAQPGTAVILRYPRAELARQLLRLDYTTVGKVRVGVSVGGGPSQTFVFEGSGRQSVPVSASTSRVAAVELRIEAMSANASLTFRGLAN